MLTPPIAVWYDNGLYDCVDISSDLSKKIHKMIITKDELSDQAYRLKNRITFIYQEASLGVDPIFELDRMKVNNYSSDPDAYLRMSHDGQWELRNGDNDLAVP